VSSMNALGILHEEGKGVERNWHEARAWYTRAAAAGRYKKKRSILKLSHTQLSIT
jgi:TPR repeat protein